MMEEQKIEKYFIKNELDIQRILSDYYSYIKTIIRNNANISLEDQEEIISDVIFIIWKNKDKLDREWQLQRQILCGACNAQRCFGWTNINRS